MMKMKRRWGTVTALLVAALCIGAMSASAAQAATWHVNGEAWSGYFEFFSPSHHGTLEMNLSSGGMNARYTCEAGTAGGSAVYGKTNFRNILWVHGCKAYNLKTGEEIPTCNQKNNGLTELLLPLEGNGEAVSGTSERRLEVQSELCPLGEKVWVSVASMSQTLNPPPYPLESLEHYIVGNGTGKFGNHSMTVHYSSLIEPSTPYIEGYGNRWGWY